MEYVVWVLKALLCILCAASLSTMLDLSAAGAAARVVFDNQPRVRTMIIGAASAAITALVYVFSVFVVMLIL